MLIACTELNVETAVDIAVRALLYWTGSTERRALPGSLLKDVVTRLSPGNELGGICLVMNSLDIH